mgnify:CR=1 FL=1
MKNNLIEIELKSEPNYTRRVWQYDYGQVLKIRGDLIKNLPVSVEVQFSLTQKHGNTITRIGNVIDDVLEVIIPNKFLNNDENAYDYYIYAFIYLTDETSGNTKYEIIVPVTSRPKPEKPTEEPLPEPNIFHETVEAVNASADRAENARDSAKESAGQAENALKEIKDTTDGLSENMEKAEQLNDLMDKKIEKGEDVVDSINQAIEDPVTVNVEERTPLFTPDSASVGQLLRIKAVNADGSVVLESVDVEEKVGDVQINGESIVEDGVAKIAAHKSRQTRNVFGTVIMGVDGDISAYRNSNGEIGYRYLPLNSIDAAVKFAMCDGKGAEWTAEEQMAARERMGINDLTLIADYTTDTDVVSLSSELNGCSEIFVYAYANFDAEKSYNYLCFLINGKSVVVGQNMSFGNVYGNYYMHAILLPGGFVSVNIGYGLQNFASYQNLGMAPFGYLKPENKETFGDTMDSVKLASVDPAKVICSGSRFMVFGR